MHTSTRLHRAARIVSLTPFCQIAFYRALPWWYHGHPSTAPACQGVPFACEKSDEREMVRSLTLSRYFRISNHYCTFLLLPQTSVVTGADLLPHSTHQQHRPWESSPLPSWLFSWIRLRPVPLRPRLLRPLTAMVSPRKLFWRWRLGQVSLNLYL